jgi:formylglycine-generating enzyme required for sulfatase activity
LTTARFCYHKGTVATISELLTIIADREATIDARVEASVALADQSDPRALLEDRVAVSDDASFTLDRHLVSVARFSEWIDAGGYDDASWWSSDGWSWRCDEDIEAPRFWGEPEWSAYLRPNHPVVGVSWFEADAFANYRGARLPTEREWELACTGGEGRRYPWGDEWDDHASSHRDYGPRSTLAIGICPRGISKHGLHDLCGNIWQWTSDERGAQRAVRGGAWNNLPWSIGCGGKNAFPPAARFSNLGFRLAFDRP